MASRALRSRAWGLSMAVHAAIGACLVVVLGRGHRHHPTDAAPPATRLVWVEPAPPAAGVAEPALPAAPVAVVPPPVVPVAPKPAPKVPALARTGDAKPAKRSEPVRPEVRMPVEPAPNAAAPATVEGASAGVPNGVAGGSVGGLGDTPLPLEAVATPPELLERVVPEYPLRARNLEVEGQVLLEVVLDRSGRPEEDIRVLKSVALLDAAAIAAVRQWRFRPARDAGGHPVRVVMEVPVRFVLR